MINNTDMETVVTMRKKYMYPSNKKEFLDFCKELDKEPIIIERVLKNNYKIYFSIYQYYKDNSKNIKELISLIL